MQSHHRSRPFPQGALELEWPFGVVPSWGKGARALYPQPCKSLMWATSVEDIQPWKRPSSGGRLPWRRANLCVSTARRLGSRHLSPERVVWHPLQRSPKLSKDTKPALPGH